MSATFHNQPHESRTIGTVGHISCRLRYTSSADSFQITRGCWFSHNRAKVMFGPNDSGSVVVAIVNRRSGSKGVNVWPVCFDQGRGVVIFPKELSRDEYHLRVELVCELDGAIIKTANFKLSMIREPEFSIHLNESAAPAS